MADKYLVYGGAGAGSVAVEAALTLAGTPYHLMECDWRNAGDELARLNPMRQLPALVLPSGELMTESAAILMQIAAIRAPSLRQRWARRFAPASCAG